MSVRGVLLIPADEALPLKIAAIRFGKHPDTVRAWFRDKGIGRQITRGGPIEISLPALSMIVHGDEEALDHLFAGDREHPSVIRHLRFLGLS